MNRLFWKFFATFWLGLVIFSSATLWVASSYLDQARSTPQPSSPRLHMKLLTDSAQHIADQQGRKGVERWLKQLDFREAVPYYLIDATGKDILQRPLPEAVRFRLQRETLRHQRQTGHATNNPAASNRRHAHQIRIPSLGLYRLLPDPQGITLSRLLKRPRIIALPLLLAALSSALICGLLARYISLPIRRLRHATQRVAAGDFGQLKPFQPRKDEIGQLTQDFDYMREQLKQLMTSHQQLLRDVSHELRSPLARLQMALGLLQQKTAKDQTRLENSASNLKHLARIETETDKMNELVGQILSLTRLDAQTAPKQFVPVDLCKLLEQIITDANFEVGQQRVRLSSQQACTINAQPALLTSAIENVVRNAIKYSPSEQLIDVTLLASADSPSKQIIICDRGPGVAEDQLANIFEPFTRLDDARNSATGGYGIGLALAKKIMSQHHGTISAFNRQGGGLCVNLTFDQTN